MAAKVGSIKQTPEAQLRILVDRLDPKVQKLFRAVRAALRKRFPTLNEFAYDYSSFVVISYTPNEQGKDGIVSIAGRDSGVQLYFNQAKKLADPKKLLKGSGGMARFIQVETTKQLADPDVTAFFAAVTENSAVPLPAKGKGMLVIKTFKEQKKPARKKK